MLYRGGFQLNQFLSELYRPLLERVPIDRRVNAELDSDLDGLPTEKTLGYLLNCQEDLFVFQFKADQAADTKRKLLAALSSIYDPLGLLAPIVLVAKLVLQDVWRLSVEWDESLPLDVVTRWRDWTEALPALESLAIRRNLLHRPQNEYRSLQLHAFSDASQDGFDAVIYLRTEDKDGGVDVVMIAAKSRVAPVRQLTIPKLELQAALIAARLASYLEFELTIPIAGTFFWCDAMTVLRWLHSKHRRFTVFVANRVAEILDSFKTDRFRHVPGDLNPADDLSRGVSLHDFEGDHRFFTGPEFLRLEPGCWPAPFESSCSTDTIDEWIGFVVASVTGSSMSCAAVWATCTDSFEFQFG